jgi:hypothetical protein
LVGGMAKCGLVWFLKIWADGLLSRVTNFDSSSLWFCSLGLWDGAKLGRQCNGRGRKEGKWVLGVKMS